MKVLFVFPNAPLSESYSGAASRFFCSYQALIRLGYEVFVWRPLSSTEIGRVEAFERENPTETAITHNLIAYWQDIEYTENYLIPSWVPHFSMSIFRTIHAIFDPYDYCFPGAASLRNEFGIILEKFNPDLVWVETTFIGAVVFPIIDIPWIYQNHDFFYRLKPIRFLAQGKKQSSRSKLENKLLKHIEFKILKKSNYIVTGSVSEANEISRHGQSNVVVIPTTYHSISLQPKTIKQTEKFVVHINHLGALSTTANYVGLKTYLETVHPQLINLLRQQNIQVELVLVGDPTNAKQDLLQLISKNNIKLLGFKKDLREVLRPFDISIIPYNENTGTRTKVPLLMNHAQIIVATENSVAGNPEVFNCEGCFFTKDVIDFLDPILRLALNSRLREKMGLAAKAFFEEHFTLESHLECYKTALDNTILENNI